jgi:hypothetical protein
MEGSTLPSVSFLVLLIMAKSSAIASLIEQAN